MATFQFKAYEDRRLRLIARQCHGRSVLDLGYAQSPNQHFSSFKVTGVDLESPTTQGLYDEEYVGDVMHLNHVLASRTFDNVVAGELIEHLERPVDFLRSLRKFLSKDGRLIISTPNPVAWPCVIFEWLRSERFYYSLDHCYYFAPRWVSRMLNRAGYRVEKTIGVGLLNPVFPLACPASFSYQVVYVAITNETAAEIS